MRTTATMLSCLALLSCTKVQEKWGDTFITDESLPEFCDSKAEIVEIGYDSIYETECYVYHDSVLIQFDIKHSGQYYFNISLLKDDHCIAQYFKRGDGPNELLNPCVDEFEENRIKICDLSTNRKGFFDIDSAIAYGNRYTPKIYQNPDRGQGECWPNDTVCVTVNGQYIEGFGLDGIKEFVAYDVKNEKPLIDSKENTKCFPFNVTGGGIVYSRENNKYCVCYMSRPRYAILDSTLTFTKKVVGPDPDDGSFHIEEGGEVWHDGVKSTYFHHPTCTKKYIIACNTRMYKTRYSDEEVSKRTEVYLLNWEGEIVARRKMNCLPLSLSYSDETRTLYYTATDEEGERKLYRCRLE